MADERFRSDRESDPIAELARLIGQADRHRRDVPAERRFRKKTTSGGNDELPELPPAPQLSGHWDAHEQQYELDEHRGSEEVDNADDQHCVAGQDYEDYQNEVPRKRHSRLTLVMAITGLALIGSAGAFGYRNILSGPVILTARPSLNTSNELNTITPASSKPSSNNSRNLSQGDTVTTGSIDNMGSREKQPVLVEPPKPVPAATDPPGPAATISASSEHVGQSGAADTTAALNPEPKSARRTKSLDALLPVLYLRGVSTGDFQEALGALLGKDAPNLSPAVISRLTAEWQTVYAPGRSATSRRDDTCMCEQTQSTCRPRWW